MSNQKLGLADITNSIFNSLSVPETIDSLSLGSAENREVLILIDGMGQDAVDKYSDQFPIFDELKQVKKLYTNFPSTTATSLSTLGLSLIHI